MNIKKITSNKKVQSFKNSKNFYESLNYAFSGLNYCLQNSSNFRIQIFSALITLLLGFLLKISNFEKIVIVATIFSVLILEILNTSIESLVDLVVGNKFNDLARICKDCSAASVLIASINSIFIAAYIFLPKIKLLLFN
tara:strand:+ start:330 stop:746 length:417 start_codon:yes stop_codon:yes gene_type:complete